MSFKEEKTVLICVSLFVLTFMSRQVQAYSYQYPQVRYQDAQSLALGGVSLPLNDSVLGSLMNNPAALGRTGRFQMDTINLNLDGNSTSIGNVGTGTASQLSLGSLAKTLRENPGETYSLGYSVGSAVSFKGFGLGILLQDRTRAVSDGTTTQYQSVRHLIPSAGWGTSLARGVVRLGYSLQYVQETSGVGSVSAIDGPFDYRAGLASGTGLSHNASVNFAFPYIYLPTVSFIARNIFGTNFSQDLGKESMVIDASIDYLIKLTGTTHVHWFLQTIDPFQTMSVPFLERISIGMDLSLSRTISLRAGLNGLRYSAGIGYLSDSTDLALTYYQEKSPLTHGPTWDSRWVLQYVLKFRDRASRDRTVEKK